MTSSRTREQQRKEHAITHRRTFTALAAGLALVVGTSIAGPSSAGASPAPAAVAPSTSSHGAPQLTNLAHLNWLGAQVTPPAQPGHTTYRLE